MLFATYSICCFLSRNIQLFDIFYVRMILDVSDVTLSIKLFVTPVIIDPVSLLV